MQFYFSYKHIEKYNKQQRTSNSVLKQPKNEYTLLKWGNTNGQQMYESNLDREILTQTTLKLHLITE